MSDRVVIVLENKGNPDSFSKRLTRALKYALHACGLKCVAIERHDTIKERADA